MSRGASSPFSRRGERGSKVIWTTWWARGCRASPAPSVSRASSTAICASLARTWSRFHACIFSWTASRRWRRAARSSTARWRCRSSRSRCSTRRVHPTLANHYKKCDRSREEMCVTAFASNTLYKSVIMHSKTIAKLFWYVAYVIELSIYGLAKMKTCRGVELVYMCALEMQSERSIHSFFAKDPQVARGSRKLPCRRVSSNEKLHTWRWEN